MRKAKNKDRSKDEPLEGQEPETNAQENQETELERLQRERDEAQENWKRALADYKNLRKRTLVDIDSATRASKQGLLSELLLVLDYLEMALQTQCETQEGKNLLFGVEMTRNQMMKFLESQDVSPLDSEGQFDPEIHQAVENVETGEVEPGTIVETVRRGYKCGDHVLRYSQVKVAAAPAPARSDEASEESAEDGAQA
jgi:molecular chaperone GrpE